METAKQSFLSNLIGSEYDTLRLWAKHIVPIGIIVLVILFGLTRVCHLQFVSRIFSLFTGYSLLFVAFITELIILLDIRVVEEKESTKYKMTMVWFIILLSIGLSAAYLTNRYRKQYAFECTTYLVDPNEKIYHLKEYKKYCEYAQEALKLEEKKGYQIDESYKFCDCCEEWAEEAEDEYGISRFSKR